MKLLQLCAAQLRLNEPLPWNVRMADGKLLLSKGQQVSEPRQLEMLLHRGMYVDQQEFDRQRRGEVGDSHEDPFVAWVGLAARANALLREPHQQPPFGPKLAQLARQMQVRAEQDPDIGSFELAHMTELGYPVMHSLHTAYLVTLVGQRLGLDAAQRHSATCAALTMNLGMLPLQAALCLQRHPPTPLQRDQIRQHPQRSVALLQSLGVDDADWLTAVAQHHEQPDGQGYPEGLREVHPLAVLLRHCDIYLAQLGSRATRAARPVNQAARDFFLREGGPQNPVAAAVVKEAGLYPPGTYVKLASGELAVVVRRGAGAGTPQVCSLVDTRGMAFPQAVPRDTTRAGHAVVAPVALAQVRVRLDRHRLFGLKPP